MTIQGEITQLLVDLSAGNAAAWDTLMAKVYHELRQIAHQRLRYERYGHTLNTTALVHEAYLKLVNLDRLQWQNQAQFFGVAAQAMRQILVDYARHAKALKRGGGQRPVVLEGLDPADVVPMPEEEAAELLALDAALGRLHTISARQAQVVELRFFGGLTILETAEVLGVSVNTVKRDWHFARAWLNRELRENSLP